MPSNDQSGDAATEVIVEFLAELIGLTREARYHNAAALIARLASHDPPILLTMESKTKCRTSGPN